MMPSELREEAYSPVTMTRLRRPEMTRRCQSANRLALVSSLAAHDRNSSVVGVCHLSRSRIASHSYAQARRWLRRGVEPAGASLSELGIDHAVAPYEGPWNDEAITRVGTAASVLAG